MTPTPPTTPYMKRQDGVKGVRYWPIGVVMDSPVFYPVGAIWDGVFTNTRVALWSSTSYNTNYGYYMTCNNSTSIQKKVSSARSNAYPIRCVQE